MKEGVKFKVGDLVQLKSGGPVMTVHSFARTGRTATGSKGTEHILSERIVICQWFNESSLSSANFDIESLVPPR